MSRRKAARNVFLVLVAIDLIAILARASIVDFYLRPLALISLFVYGYFLQEELRTGTMLILVGLGIAAAVEVVQRMHSPLWVVTAGTVAYYACYSVGFMLNRSARYNPRTLIPFAVVAAYGIIMFFILEPYGIVRQWSIFYIIMVTILAGFSLNPWLAGNRTRSAGFLAVAGPVLLLSDSIRISVIVKMAAQADTYLVMYGMEALIMLLYYGGQFAVIRSLAIEEEEGPDAASGGTAAAAAG